jgi:hypothetical protein
MSSPAEGLFSKESINSFIQNDEVLKPAFANLIFKKRPQSWPKSSSDILPEALEFIQNISYFATALFKIVQNEAANGQLSVKISDSNRSHVIQYFELPLLKDALPFIKIIQKLFVEKLKIKIDSKGFDWNLSWNSDNPFLRFKPNFEKPFKMLDFHKEYFTDLLENGPFDVIFLIGNEKIKAHSRFLSQSKVLTFLVERQKEKNEVEKLKKEEEEAILIKEIEKENTPIKKENEITIELKDFSPHIKGFSPHMKNFSPHIFKAMIRFLYIGEIEENDTKNYKTLFQLYDLGDYIQNESLKQNCKVWLSQMIDDKSFLTFAFYHELFKDEHLLSYCQWFINKNFDYGAHIDMSHFNFEQLMETYQVCLKFEARKLEETCINLMREQCSHFTSDELLKAYQVCRKFKAKEQEETCLNLLKNQLNLDDLDLADFQMALSVLDDKDLLLWLKNRRQYMEIVNLNAS